MKRKSKNNKLQLVLLCGGPSPERGISLNSARSACDHLDAPDLEITPIYFDVKKNAYKISRSQLYSNTPSDFDFKLKNTSLPLSRKQLEQELCEADLAFPVIHGEFGEDGQVQKILEKLQIPFIGPSSTACRKCFDKFGANNFLAEKGYFTNRSIAIDWRTKQPRLDIEKFFKQFKIKRAVVKPASGGSSIGVISVETVKQAEIAANKLLNDGYKKVVVEPFCRGREFTVIILENANRKAVALPPIEIETDYAQGEIFDFRKKYLATNRVAYHCPPRFKNQEVKRIQKQAEELFMLFGLKGFSRFDGWLLDDGSIWFSDFNPISGMEQNSFLFIAASQLGMSHADIMRYLLWIECQRNNLALSSDVPKINGSAKKRVNIIFGGASAERQVSLMSGTNVWLKLLKSRKYDPKPYLLDTAHNVWELPYHLTLNHTVEEIMERCRNAKKFETRRKLFVDDSLRKLGLHRGQCSQKSTLPKKITLSKFIANSSIVFNTIHGDIGEDGRIQRKFEKAAIAFNGSDSKSSKLCIDKFETGLVVTQINDSQIRTARKMLLKVKELSRLSLPELKRSWRKMQEELNSETLIVKPRADGCSAGIVRLYTETDLKKYLSFLKSRKSSIPANYLTRQSSIIEMPTTLIAELLFEEFVETDRVAVLDNKLVWKTVNNWVEITVGLLGRKGEMKSLNPSITIANSSVLSLEEKFQGGTGVNITPPPEKYVSAKIRNKAMRRIETVAQALGISGYARIDAFMNIKTGEMIVIEANTLPGLTGSTVIFHQALCEKPPMYPKDFLERIVELSCS